MKFGVYLLIKDHHVVYIGQTWQIDVRIKAHKRSKDFDRYHFFKCPAEKLNWFEEELINRFRPIHNKQRVVSNTGSIRNAIVGEMHILINELANGDKEIKAQLVNQYFTRS